MFKCPLCQLDHLLKDVEYENDSMLAQHCSKDHSSLALAYSFIDNYFGLKKLIEDIEKTMNDLANTGLKYQFQIASYNTLKAILEQYRNG